MNYEADIYIKDEGDFMTVCFQNEKSIKVLKETQPIEIIESTYGSVNYKKLDLQLGQKNAIFAFAISHNLTIQSEI